MRTAAETFPPRPENQVAPSVYLVVNVQQHSMGDYPNSGEHLYSSDGVV